MANVLFVNPKKCNGCKECESACVERRVKMHIPPFSSIQVIHGDSGSDFYLPTTCQHCDTPPCRAVCLSEAIHRDGELGRVVIDSNRCVGCQMCVSACPFGAIGFDYGRGFAFKCDLCEGEPECVRVCKQGALEYIDGNTLNNSRIIESANKHYAVLRHQIA